LKTENKTPEKLAYDRPSEKLISFLKKHYNLSSFIPQNNNFVIFDRFFGKNEKVFGNESHNKTFSLGQKSEGNNIKQKVE
jgi:alpha-tubulin N-acetyltransferase 1